MKKKKEKVNVINVWGLANIGCTITNPIYQTMTQGNPMYKDETEEKDSGDEQIMEVIQEEETQETPNYFAPQKNIAVFLCEEWFDGVSTNKKKYTPKWRETLMEKLMNSEHKDEIAKEWADKKKQTQLKCKIVGALIKAKVLKGSYREVASKLNIDKINFESLAKYMGYNEVYTDWIMNYVRS